MTWVFQGLGWYALVFAGGVAGFAVTRRMVPQAPLAWALARVVGFALPAFAAWYAGLAGLAGWVWVSLPLVGLGVFWGAKAVSQEKPSLKEVELVGLAAFWLLAWLRAPNYAVTGTEKPMDLAILAALLRPQALPPEDPWFAGYPLPYYSWGFMPWALPAKVSGFFPDEAFNLLVPTLASLTAQLAYGWARAAGLSRGFGVWAAAASVFLGTAEGWTQVFAGKAGFFTTNLWDASRGIAHTITEFPLFTFHLGDLHPHLLCQPWVLSALAFWEFGKASRLLTLALRAFLFGLAAATNPWTVPFLGLSVVAISLARDDGRWRDLGITVAAGMAAFLLFFPAWANLPAAAAGLGWVHTPTTMGEIVRVLLPALAPLAVLAVWFYGQTHRVLGVPAAAFALALLAVLTARPLVALAFVMAAALFGFARGQRGALPAAALAAACLLALVGMELLYVKDPYGPEWYRMNTVFKTLSFVFLVLPVPSLRLLAQAAGLGLRQVRAWLAVPWFLALPQLATVAKAAWPLPQDFAGLRWMAEGEAEAAHWLHRGSTPEVLVEAVGDAYSDAARMSACSGVPAVLGWDNHEGLWRPGDFQPLIADRKAKVQELYRCQDSTCVAQRGQELGATLLVLGSVERRLYPELSQEALRGAGEVAFSQGEVTIIRLAPPEP
ncbi:MAG: DUF2298 domain-containing protein [Thermoanaerobaculum sp.]